MEPRSAALCLVHAAEARSFQLAVGVGRPSQPVLGRRPVRASKWFMTSRPSRSNRMGFPSIAQRGRLGGRTL